MKNHICILWNPNICFNNTNNNNQYPSFFAPSWFSWWPSVLLLIQITSCSFKHNNYCCHTLYIYFFIYGLDHPTSLIYSENKSTNTNIFSFQPFKDKHIENRTVTVVYFAMNFYFSNIFLGFSWGLNFVNCSFRKFHKDSEIFPIFHTDYISRKRPKSTKSTKYNSCQS